MFRILSSRRYWSLISKISDQKELIKNLENTVKYQNTYIKALKAQLGSAFDIDFPGTDKIFNNEDINQILKL